MSSMQTLFRNLIKGNSTQHFTYQVLKNYAKPLAGEFEVACKTAEVVIGRVLEKGLMQDLLQGQVALKTKAFRERLTWEFEIELSLLELEPEASIQDTWEALQHLVAKQSRQVNLYLEELYQELQPSLVNSLAYKAGHRKLAEDLVQEAFCAFIEKLDKGAFDGENPYGYIKRIAEYKLMNHLRLRKNQSHSPYEEVSFFMGESDLSDSLFGLKASLFKWAIGFIFQHRHSLGYVRCMSFILYLKGYQHKEIGEKLGIKSGYSRKLVSEMASQHLLPNWRRQGG